MTGAVEPPPLFTPADAAAGLLRAAIAAAPLALLLLALGVSLQRVVAASLVPALLLLLPAALLEGAALRRARSGLAVVGWSLAVGLAVVLGGAIALVNFVHQVRTVEPLAAGGLRPDEAGLFAVIGAILAAVVALPSAAATAVHLADAWVEPRRPFRPSDLAFALALTVGLPLLVVHVAAWGLGRLLGAPAWPALPEALVPRETAPPGSG